MSAETDPTRRTFVSYIDKSREYALARGREPHAWAHFDHVPFAPLRQALSESRIGLVTTASLADPTADLGREIPPLTSYAAPTSPPPRRLYTQHLGWDKDATHTDDLESFFPIQRLTEFVAEGRLGSLSRRFYGVRVAQDAPQLLRWCQADSVDVAMLVPL